MNSLSWPESSPRWPRGSEVLRASPLSDFRLAPSIISRSEAELFGLSVPRFALRVRLNHGGRFLGFVNARRLATFGSQMPSWAERIATTGRISDLRRDLTRRPTPAALLRKNSCIADAILQMPARFASSWTMLQADLSKAYGEASQGSWRGTPFIRHIALTGGGLCAQATCFMATALLHDEAKGVHGIADVTALATQQHLNELRLTGLSERELSLYFSHPDVGLNARWQQPRVGRLPEPTIAFREAMKAYLQSGMPIVLPVDAGRLAGQNHDQCPLRFGASVVRRNGCPPGLWFNRAQKHPRHHAVLVVGTDNSDLFAINDPASLPFLVASSAELSDVGIYRDFDVGQMRPCLFLPVTPAAVRMPLVDAPATREERQKNGLWSLRLPLQGPLRRIPELPAVPPTDPGVWRLARAKDLPKRIADLDQHRAQGVEILVQELLQSGHGEHWCWLQCNRSNLWLWDAEKEPVNDQTWEASLSFLLATAISRGGGWKIEHVQRLPRQLEAPSSKPREAAKPERLRPSLISSFCVAPFSKMIHHWPDAVKHCEVYAFMQPDAERLLPDHAPVRTWKAWHATMKTRLANWARYIHVHTYKTRFGWPWFRFSDRYPTGHRKPFTTAMQRLASAQRADERAGKETCAARVANDLHATLREKRGIQVSSFATYFPEISSPNQDAADDAQKALLMLMRTSRLLRELEHPVKTIEVVAGSRINGVWPAEPIKKERYSQPAFVANRLAESSGIERLLDRLLPIANAAQENGVSLALELEPGPLYVLGEWQSIVKLCKMLEKDVRYAPLKPILGLNLDVAHWGILKGITPASVLRCTSVANRVAHAHLADHASGHFGDITLFDHHAKEYFAEWISALETLAKDITPREPGFSGFVSLEFESCHCPHSLQTAVRRFREFFPGE